MRDIELNSGNDNGEPDPDEPLFDFFLEEGEDAMTRLGFGIVSYFGLIWTFLLVFFCITVINIPVMYFNSTWEAFNTTKQLSWTAQYTTGNLGQSMSRCLSLRLKANDIAIGCNTGRITEITHFGVYAKDSEAD